ncbi:8-amino-7-oxononanoate synthase [Paenibacillus filicis]|uniref:8-amino-7-ketopelargonate synthase n=1 Tax=Paenibacillus gyeongsangnamensis TaxID=3388067 RepID=A0ABT4Q8I1_9BACL|nr:8-amino-7-oxononanoate synthase [Paenibacillus filicis]MCZ8513134.1 8-amino-7-oxononanoate synthase [Paenibacillus filicis]
MDWMNIELEAWAGEAKERVLRESIPARNRTGYIERGGRLLLNLSSNDYLGLAGHPAILEAMRDSLLHEAAGSGASRLVTGNGPSFSRLEEAVAQWQQSEAALVFANGYAANSGVISALVGRGDVVFSDRLNHASIVDGITLSRAEHARYRHNDMEHLHSLLTKYQGARRKLIVTDTVFSMDGDHALLRKLVQLKREHGAMLMVDEAHGSGIYGAHGEGLCHKMGLKHEVDVHMGTFSKAFGVYGAYVCGSRTLIRWLVNKARPLIYSTALPPVVLAGVYTALELVRTEAIRRVQLDEGSRLLRDALREAGFRVGSGDSPIIPVVIGDNDTALSFSSALEEEGIAAVAIRPPTVPEGTARIRFSVSAAHTAADLLDAAVRIRRVGLRMGVIVS